MEFHPVKIGVQEFTQAYLNMPIHLSPINLTAAAMH